MLTPEKIEELRALLAKATPGPWKNHLVDDTTIVASNGFEIGTTWPGGSVYNGFVDPAEQHEINAALIVAMRNALPALLDAAERLGKVGSAGNMFASTMPTTVDLAAANYARKTAERERDEALSLASRAREDALREAAGVARQAYMRAHRSGDDNSMEPDEIAAAIHALIDKPKGGDAND